MLCKLNLFNMIVNLINQNADSVGSYKLVLKDTFTHTHKSWDVAVDENHRNEIVNYGDEEQTKKLVWEKLHKSLTIEHAWQDWTD